MSIIKIYKSFKDCFSVIKRIEPNESMKLFWLSKAQDEILIKTGYLFDLETLRKMYNSFEKAKNETLQKIS